MTTASPAGSPPPPEATATPAQRRRFAVALAVFGAWVAALAVLAFRSAPPRPIEAEAGAARPAAEAR